MPAEITCPYCGRPNEDNPSDYYHRSDCQSRYLAKRIEREGPDARLWGDHGPKLKDALERARYVGD